MILNRLALAILVFFLPLVSKGENKEAPSPVVFSAMGCGPYSPAAEEALARYLGWEAQSGSSSFIVHCGDIVTGKVKTWPESQFARVAGILHGQSKIPTFIVPGDNEWNDQLNPDESWGFWEKHFLKLDEQWTLPKSFSPIARQAIRPENFAFTLDRVLFIGINKVGGLIHDQAEWDQRLREDADWLAEQFEKHGESTHSAVIFAQAVAGGKDMSLAKAVRKIGNQYAKPILYIHADGHKWIVEPSKWGEHVTRVQLDVVSEAFPPIQVTVTGDPESPFQFDRRLDDPDWKFQPTKSIWSLSGGGEGNDKIRGIAAGEQNSVFVTGEISENANLGGHEFPSGGNLDFVVAKLDANGHVLWATSAGGPEIDRGYGVSPTDDGGCYVTGHFESETISFGDIELKSVGDYDGFVARFDAKGTCLWAKRFGGRDYDYGHGISTAPDGSAVLAGAIANMGEFGGTSIGIEKGRSAVLANVSPDGEVHWVKSISGPSISGHNVSVGGDGMIYLGGYTRGQVNWSDAVSTESAVQDMFVAKYDSAGTFQWVRTAGGKSDGLATSVAVDETSGNVCLAGMFKGTATFGSQSFQSRGKHDFYVAVVSPEGEFLHAHHGGGEDTDYGLGATSLPGGGFAITGEITDSGEFDGKTHLCAGERDAFVAIINESGSEVESFRLLGDKDSDLSYAITATKDDSVTIAGAFRNETQFGELKLKAKKGNDIFIGKFPR